MNKKCHSLDGGESTCPIPQLNIYEVLGGQQYPFVAKAMFNDLVDGVTEGVSFAPFSEFGILIFDRTKGGGMPFTLDLTQLVSMKSIRAKDWGRRQTER